MNYKRRWTKTQWRLAILATALLGVVALALALHFNPDLPDLIREAFMRLGNGSSAAGETVSPELSSEIEKIARAWAANNINGAAGDEIVNLIVRKSNTKQPDMLKEYLRERVESATDWSYGPVAKASENVYDLTAAASTRVHDTMPPPTISFVGVINAPTPDPADFRRIATAPFRLTVDADTMSVTDWRLSADGAGVVSSFGSDSIAMFEDVYEESAADCINAAMMEDPTEQDARALFLSPDAREEADAARLRAFADSAGLGEICEDWIGE